MDCDDVSPDIAAVNQPYLAGFPRRCLAENLFATATAFPMNVQRV